MKRKSDWQYGWRGAVKRIRAKHKHYQRRKVFKKIMENKNSNRVVLRGIVNYPALAQPKSIRNSPPKYSICLLIPKGDIETLNKYQRALEAAYEDGDKKLMSGKTKPTLHTLTCPLHDGNVEKPGQEAFADRFYLNAKNSEKVSVVDRDLNPIDPSEIYSGCIVNASITMSAFKTDFSKGISAYLNGIQLIKKGERIGWGPRINNDFQVLPDEDDETDIPF